MTIFSGKGKTKLTILAAASIMFILMSISPHLSQADILTLQREYVYQASEIDSKISSRTIALEQVKRLLMEELGTYLESKTEVVNFQLTKDQVTALTAGIVKTEIVTEKWDGKTYHLVAKIVADPDEVAKSVDILRKNQEKTKELEETRIKADKALKEVEKLKKELEVSKKDKVKIDQYNEAVQELAAADLIEKGVALSKANHYSSAIEMFKKAIKINPKYAWAYYHRGITYKKTGNYKHSINDFTESIKIDPSFSWAYYNRGLAYNKIGKRQQALSDIKKAAQLGDSFAQNYLQKKGIRWTVEAIDKYANLMLQYTSMLDKNFTDTDCMMAKQQLEEKFYELQKSERVGDKSKYADVIGKYLNACENEPPGAPGISDLNCDKASDIFGQTVDEIKGVEHNKILKEIKHNKILYVASRNSNVFHISDCKWAKKISPKNRIVYKNRNEAVKNQKTPCTACNP